MDFRGFGELDDTAANFREEPKCHESIQGLLTEGTFYLLHGAG